MYRILQTRVIAPPPKKKLKKIESIF